MQVRWWMDVLLVIDWVGWRWIEKLVHLPFSYTYGVSAVFRLVDTATCCQTCAHTVGGEDIDMILISDDAKWRLDSSKEIGGHLTRLKCKDWSVIMTCTISNPNLINPRRIGMTLWRQSLAVCADITIRITTMACKQVMGDMIIVTRIHTYNRSHTHTYTQIDVRWNHIM